MFSLSLERVVGAAYSSIRPTSSDSSYGITSFNIAGPALNPVALPRLGFDVILPSGITLGGAVGYGSIAATVTPDNGTSSSLSAHAFLISPRIGYRIPVSKRFDFVPRAGVTLAGAGTTGPDRSLCSYDSNPPYSQNCRPASGNSGSLLVGAASLEALGTYRVTESFNLLGGLSYDHVFTASGSTDSTVSDGSRLSTDAQADGKYLGLQLWAGLGGYF